MWKERRKREWEVRSRVDWNYTHGFICNLRRPRTKGSYVIWPLTLHAMSISLVNFGHVTRQLQHAPPCIQMGLLRERGMGMTNRNIKQNWTQRCHENFVKICTTFWHWLVPPPPTHTLFPALLDLQICFLLLSCLLLEKYNVISRL